MSRIIKFRALDKNNKIFCVECYKAYKIGQSDAFVTVKNLIERIDKRQDVISVFELNMAEQDTLDIMTEIVRLKNEIKMGMGNAANKS